MLSQGPDAGKIAAIVNVIDQNRVLIDGPTSGVSRQEYPLKQLELTPIRVKFAFNARTRVVRKEMEAGKVTLVWWCGGVVCGVWCVVCGVWCVVVCGGVWWCVVVCGGMW